VKKTTAEERATELHALQAKSNAFFGKIKTMPEMGQ
jgi:hypothetical protein